MMDMKESEQLGQIRQVFGIFVCVLVTGQELLTLRKRLRFFFPQRLIFGRSSKNLENQEFSNQEYT